MSEQHLDRLRSVMAKQLGLPVEKITPSLKMGDHPRWDSMGHMTIVASVEKEFGVRIPSYALARVTSVDLMAKELGKLSPK